MAGKSAVVRVAIVGDNSSLTRSLGDSQSKLRKFGSTIAKIGVTAGLAAGAGLALFAKASVDAASDAQQSLGATETVFGKFSDRVIKSSEAAAEALGLSATSYRENANILGSLLANQGVSADKLAGKTRGLIQTGADLAATFGGTTTDAVNALASAFKGEFDPLEAYGISIKQSTINTEAFRVAGVKTQKAFDELSTAQQNAAKQQATTNLLTKQAAKTHGAFAKETDTLAHQQQVLSAQFENVKAKIGTALLPVMTQLTKWVGDHLIPKLDDLGVWLNTHQDEIGDWGEKAADTGKEIGKLAKKIGEDLWPALKQVGGIIADLIGWFNDLPDPIQDTGVKAAAAALLIWKLKPALDAVKASAQGAATQVRTFGTEMKTAESRRATFAGGLKSMGGVARGAAGVGGLLLLSENSDTATRSMQTLRKVGGGALMGFSAGGPVGAAIGATAGLLLAVATNAEIATGKAKPLTQTIGELAKNIDPLTGKLRENARVSALKFATDNGLIDSAKQFGVSTNTLVSAMTGQKTALQQVHDQMQNLWDSTDGLTTATDEQKGAYWDLHRQIGSNMDQHGLYLDQQKEARRQVLAQQEALRNYGKEYKKLPQRVVTHFEQEGAPKSLKQLANLATRYRLTPKQVKTILRVEGIKGSLADVQRLQDKLAKARNTHGKLDTFLNDVRGDIKRSQVLAETGGRQVGEKLKTGTKKAKADLGPFKQSVKHGTDEAAQTASTGGNQVGTSLKTGVLGGVGGLGPLLSQAVAGAVHSAIAAGRAAAGAKSPSKRMYELGVDMGDGLVLGVNSKQDDAKKAGHKLIDQLFGGAGVTAGLETIQAGLEGVNKLVERVVNKRIKDDKKAGKFQQRILDGLRAQTKALRANGKQQDENTNKLKAARDAVEAYRAAIKESFVAFGDITQLGRTDSGKVTLAKLLRDLGKRAAEAKEFQTLLQQLAAAGLDQTQIEQLTAAGPEAALATARAIASGGQFAIDQVNAFSRDIAKSGSALGKDLADRFSVAGESSASAYIAELERQQNRLDRSAQKMATALVKQLQAELAAVPIIKEKDKGKDGGKHGKSPSDNAVNGASDKQTVTVKLTAQHISSLERGREIQLDLDTYRAAGGRARV